MNRAFVCAQLNDDPREVYVSSTNTVMRCNVLLPPVGNKAPTPLEYTVYGKQIEKFKQYTKGTLVYIHSAKLRFDLESRTYSLHGGICTKVTEQFPILNDIILTGRCIKTIGPDDSQGFKTTPDGYMICNQTLSVVTGAKQADLFNFYAINKKDDRVNYAELLVNLTRKGTGLTIEGKLVTDSWTDKTTKERKSNTKIQLTSMTLAPKADSSVVKAQQPEAGAPSPSAEAPSLWGGRSAEVEDASNGLPDLPGHYGSAPSFDSNDAPF